MGAEEEEGAEEAEVMLHGTVEYRFKDGGSLVKDFAVRAELVREEGDWKIRVYQVYLMSVMFAFVALIFCARGVVWGFGGLTVWWWIGYGIEGVNG